MEVKANAASRYVVRDEYSSKNGRGRGRGRILIKEGANG